MLVLLCHQFQPSPALALASLAGLLAFICFTRTVRLPSNRQ